MAFVMNKNDRRVLALIAEHRVLSVSQLTAIQQKSSQVVRRRLRALEEEGMVQSASRCFGGNRGRPEHLISLTSEGIRLVCSEAPELNRIPENRITAENIRCLDHHLLANWFQIHLRRIEQAVPQVSVRFLSPTSPFLGQDPSGRPLVFERVPQEDSSNPAGGFTPDGAFAITHRERRQTLHFFLEVDMGTESLASSKKDSRDIRQKIINYQGCFRRRQYKRYEQLWDCGLTGFRLLFLVNTRARLAALCRLVQEMKPSDFIWLTSAEQMFASGLADTIWARGGRQDTALESILGTELACPIPPLPLPE